MNQISPFLTRNKNLYRAAYALVLSKTLITK